MADVVPLSALLSHSFVAFVVEFDNEFEHRAPHRTTNHGSTGGSRSAPWLVSFAMWIKFLRFVPDEGITVGEFQKRAALPNKDAKSWLTRLSKWWGYLAIKKGVAEDPLNWVIRPTSGGKKALQVWRPLSGIIEARWRERFGGDGIEKLYQPLRAIADRLNPQLPDCLPILGYDMLSHGPDPERHAEAATDTGFASERTLPMLLSKVLLAFAIRYERDTRLSLAVSANVLRLVSDEGIPVRDLPRLSGVAKEAVAMAVKRLERGGLAAPGLAKVLTLTADGLRARDTYPRSVRAIEKRWEARFGSCVPDLRRALEDIAEQREAGQSRLLAGLQPYSDGWRASVPQREVLPHYPMVLHRGGFPDGS